MRLHRRPTRWLSTWLALLLLSMQLATSAYACPAAQAMAAMAEMPGCDGNMAGQLDPEQPQLCQAHCQQGSQSVQPTPAADAPAQPVLLAVLDWRTALQLPRGHAAQPPERSAGASPPGAPPRYLVLLVLRN